jgi:hypothetical protein
MASSRPWPFDDDPDRPSGSVRPLSRADLQAILAHLGDDPEQLLAGTSADRPVVAVRVRATVGRPDGSTHAAWRRVKAAEWVIWIRTLPWRVAATLGIGAAGGANQVRTRPAGYPQPQVWPSPWSARGTTVPAMASEEEAQSWALATFGRPGVRAGGCLGCAPSALPPAPDPATPLRAWRQPQQPRGQLPAGPRGLVEHRPVNRDQSGAMDVPELPISAVDRVTPAA